MGRSITLSPDQQSGKAAFKSLVKSFGGQDAASSETGVRRQKISDMGLPNVAEFPTLDLIDSLEDRTVGLPGWPHVTNWLCRRRGGVFVPLPQGEHDADGMMLTVAELAGELGDVSRSISDAVSASGDGGRNITVAEAHAALAELDGLDRTSAQLRLKLIAKVKGE
ncbi:hypothetical protein K3M67_03110 [Sphingobium sp. V4]|uniref:hypothetical protein n=1 Tax=Sphingobium sp. V4 TaxID=3038927 RepID=UPI002557CBF3|nr:hypothetical protein [Sphingobium sp. V4]WIW88986.1 hypothetical protein K3M67_03110 [Sphingobium sp. V4]